MSTSWRDLFNSSKLKSDVAASRTVPSSEVQKEGSFVTPQSITSFAGASFVVGLLWQSSEYLHAGASQSQLVGLGISVIVGAFLFFISATDPNGKKMQARDWFIDGIVAFINSLVLFSAALGGSSLVSGT